MKKISSNKKAVSKSTGKKVRTGTKQKTPSSVEKLLAQRESELAIINSVQAALAAQLDMHGIFEAVGEKLRDIFDYQDVTIYSADTRARVVTVEYSYELGQKSERRSIPMNSLYEYFLTSNKTFVLNGNVPSVAEKFSDYQNPEPPKSLLAVPVRRNKDTEPVVYLTIQDWGSKKFFSDADVRLMETLANSMSVALENARLFEAERQRNAELAVINEIGQGLAKELGFQAIIDLVGDKVRDIFSAQATMIFLYNATTNILSYPYFHKHGQRFHSDPRQINPQLDPGFLALIIRTQQRVVINQNLEQEMLKVGESLMTGTAMFESMAYVPILAGDQVIGVLGLESKDKNAFPELAVNLLTTIAANLGVALENARLFDETQQRNTELAIINSVQEGLASKLDFDSIIELVGNEIREIFTADVVGIGVYESEKNLFRYPYILDHGERYYPEPVQAPQFLNSFGSLTEPVLFHTFQELQEFMKTSGIRNLGGPTADNSHIILPIRRDAQFIGLISIAKLPENAFDNSDVRLLQTLASSMSVALENARLWEQEKIYRKALQRELEIGREIQSGFLPETLPLVEGWEIAATLMSAREVAGDFYDAFELPDRTIGLVIADVCDKGVGAALFMTLFRSLIRAASNLDHFEHTGQAASSPSVSERLQRAVSLTNNYIAETHGESGMFATIFFGILDPRDGKFVYVNGGHETPLIIHAGTSVETLYKTGPAVGAITNCQFQLRETQMSAGDIFLAFTDGVPDCKNPREEFFGHDRLLEIFQNAPGSAHELVKSFESILHEYIAGATQFDDITLLAVRRD